MVIYAVCAYRKCWAVPERVSDLTCAMAHMHDGQTWMLQFIRVADYDKWRAAHPSDLDSHG